MLIMTGIRQPLRKLRSNPTSFFRALLLWCFLCMSCAVHSQISKRQELRTQLRLMEKRSSFTVQDTAYLDLVNSLAQEMRYYQADSLLKLASDALQISEQMGYLGGKSVALMQLGNYFSDRGKTDSALAYYRKALNLAEQINSDKLKLNLLNVISGEYEYKGDHSKALSGYLAALEMAIGQEDLLQQSIINENIANLYAGQKYYDESLEYYNKVKKLNDSLGNEIAQAETMSNLASVYADIKNLEYAMFNVNRSIDIFEKYRIMDWLAFAYETKGKVYLKKYNYNWALYWYRQSELLHENLDDDRARIDLFNGMAETYIGLENDSLATRYAEEAFRISRDINFTEGTRKCSKTLYEIYRRQQDYATALAYHELFQELSDTLSRNENRQSLSLLKTKTDYEQQKETLIRENEKALASQKRFIYFASGLLLFSILVIYLVYRSKKLQQRLTRELEAKHEILEKRKAELQADNETKVKLFSIIGHDLRGPVGALKELLQIFKDGEISIDELASYMPKLRSDVDHIFFTLNNLLSWGYSQLNGSVTRPTAVLLDNIAAENIKLLNEIAENKSIKIVSEIPAHTQVWSDPNQVDIVLRNLISNALKFTPENGMVTLSAEEKNDYWIISIRDTGVGMDRLTLQKIFKSDNTHSTYGTANEKGTGLGLSLCKEMILKNGGEIWVDSLLRKGSTFYFTLPKASGTYSKAV
jgi:signal transduction histidine kinase